MTIRNDSPGLIGQLIHSMTRLTKTYPHQNLSSWFVQIVSHKNNYERCNNKCHTSLCWLDCEDIYSHLLFSSVSLCSRFWSPSSSFALGSATCIASRHTQPDLSRSRQKWDIIRRTHHFMKDVTHSSTDKHSRSIRISTTMDPDTSDQVSIDKLSPRDIVYLNTFACCILPRVWSQQPWIECKSDEKRVNSPGIWDFLFSDRIKKCPHRTLFSHFQSIETKAPDVTCFETFNRAWRSEGSGLETAQTSLERNRIRKISQSAKHPEDRNKDENRTMREQCSVWPFVWWLFETIVYSI